MTREFAAAGCTFFAFDTRESAKGIDLFGYENRPMETGARGGVFGKDGVFSESSNVVQDEKGTGLDYLKMLTDRTGGKYYSNINRYEKNFDQVQNITGTFYVLGYPVDEKWDGKFHEVKVEVKRKGCEVRAQAGYFNPKPFGEYSDLEKQIHLFDLALNERAFSRLPANVSMTALAYTRGGGSRLGIMAHVPPEVTAKLSGKRIEFVLIYFTDDGEIGAVVRAETDPAAYRGRAMVFTTGAELKPGSYSCRLVVRDMDTGMSAVGSVRATQGTPSPAGLQLSTPLLLTEGAGGSYFDAGPSKKRDAWPIPEVYAFDRTWLSPLVAELPPQTGHILVMIPYSAPGPAEPDLAVSAYAVDAKSGARTAIAITRAGRAASGPAGALTLEIPVGGFAPGTYYLHFNATDRASQSLGHASTTLIVAPR
jgi:hypothetical protein